MLTIIVMMSKRLHCVDNSLDSDKTEALKKANRRRRRDREPSRIPVKKILNGLKKKTLRKGIQTFVRQHFPRTSFISKLCKDYKTWNLWYNTDKFYSKYIYFMKIQKCHTIKTQPTSCGKINLPGIGSYSKSTTGFFQIHNENSSLKGGMARKTAINSHDSP